MDDRYFKRIDSDDDYNLFFSDIIKVSLIGVSNDREIRVARESIYEKIWMLLEQSRFYIVEDQYVEPEWKDMISYHYINTTYRFENTVCRIHLFADNNCINENYLGFFTLRKINEPSVLFSKMFPNWNNLKVDNVMKGARIVATNMSVHIFETCVEILTTPYFVQDGVVTCCAHSCLLMLSNFLRMQYNMKKINISDLIKNYTFSRERDFPTKGLNSNQIREILYNNGISCEVNGIVDNCKSKINDFCLSKIKSQIDSNIPVIMGYKLHTVLIIGYFIDEHNKTNFIFYDDSGYLVNLLNYDERKEKIYSNFIFSINENMFQNNKEKFIFFFIQPDRVYTSSYDVKRKCDALFGFETSTIKNVRLFMADISICKDFLKSAYDDEKRIDDVDFFCSLSNPHYVWCYEFDYINSKLSKGKLNMIFFVDSTYNMMPRSYIRGLNGNNNIPFVVKEKLYLNYMLHSYDSDNSPVFYPKSTGAIRVNLENMYSTSVGNPPERENGIIDISCIQEESMIEPQNNAVDLEKEREE